MTLCSFILFSSIGGSGRISFMTKIDIIATVGSASESVDVLEKMIQGGLTIVRLNMSHGDHEEHHRQVVNLKKAEKKTGKKIKILVDLAGPKIRIGEIEEDTVLTPGSKVTITTKACKGNAERFSILYKKLPKEVRPGLFILLSDGKRKLEVLSTNGTDEIVCKVITGGPISSRKGVNIPGADLTIPVITPKDKIDLQFAVDHKADYVAVSFIRSAKDILNCRKLLQERNSKAHIIAKIETREAMKNLEEIIKVSDGVMIARGDLAMEIGFEHVPLAQRKTIAFSKEMQKFCIVATQLLDSMEKSPTPTRAEVSDVAYALLDGASAVMLSGETTIGCYPVESVQTLARVAGAL